MSSATATSSPEGDTIPHPLESFCSSLDYHLFESSVIHPFFLQAKICDSINVHPCTSLSFTLAPGCPPLDGFITFLADTDYNQIAPSKPLPSLPCSDVSSTQIEGYSSQVHPDCFIWEYGHFEEGSVVLWGEAVGW
jgi:hypothetical protein